MVKAVGTFFTLLVVVNSREVFLEIEESATPRAESRDYASRRKYPVVADSDTCRLLHG